MFDRFDWINLNPPWPFIFIGRGGRTPLGVEFYTNPASKYNFKFGLCSLDRSDWSTRPVLPVRPCVKSSRSHNSLIRTPNWTFYICISIVSTRATQWWSPICIFDKVTLTGQTGLCIPVWSVCTVCQFWSSTMPSRKLLFTCIPFHPPFVNR